MRQAPSPQNVTISVGTAHANLTCYGFHVWAEDFLTPGRKRFQYFDVVDAMTAFKGAPEYAALEELATRMQSSKLREAVLRA